MSIATILGILASLALVMGSILHTTNNLAIFWELTGFLIVVGLTFTTAFMAYEARYVVIALKMIPRIMAAPKIGRQMLRSEVGRVIRWGYAMQKSGVPGLESEARKVSASDKFVRFGLEMVVTGYKAEQVRHVLTNALESTFHRNTVPADILRTLTANAPTFGMLATVIGLILMLDSMGTNPGGLGPAMAVAMSGTLYGVGLARLVFDPAARKLQQREEIVRFRNYLIMEGLVLLCDRQSPRYIQDVMNSFLDPSLHYNIDKMMGSASREAA